MKIIILFSFFYSFSGYCYFQELYQGFKNSKDIALAKTDAKLLTTSAELKESQYAWDFTVSLNDSDSFVESLRSFNSQRTKSRTMLMGVSKDTFDFGTFGVSYQETLYDISSWESSALSSFSLEELLESKYAINYQYEILNDYKKIDQKIIATEKSVATIQDQLSKEQLSFDFFSTYLLVKQSIVNYQVHLENLKLSKLRFDNVKRRVKDGLSKKIDLYQAESAYIEQESLVESVRLSIEESKKQLESVIGRKIPQEILKKLNWPKAFDYKTPEAIESKKLSVLRLQNRLAKLQSQQAKESNSHSLSIGGEYSKNSFDENQTESRNDLFENKFEDRRVFIAYKIPIGTRKSSLLETRQKLTELKASLAEKIEEESLKDRLNFLTQGMEKNSKHYNAAKKKERLLLLAAKEGRTLYKRGQRSLDDILRLEESLVSASLDKYQRLYNLESAQAEVAYLSGHILDYLELYKD